MGPTGGSARDGLAGSVEWTGQRAHPCWLRKDGHQLLDREHANSTGLTRSSLDVVALSTPAHIQHTVSPALPLSVHAAQSQLNTHLGFFRDVSIGTIHCPATVAKGLTWS